MTLNEISKKVANTIQHMDIGHSGLPGDYVLTEKSEILLFFDDFQIAKGIDEGKDENHYLFQVIEDRTSDQIFLKLV